MRLSKYPNEMQILYLGNSFRCGPASLKFGEGERPIFIQLPQSIKLYFLPIG